MEAVILVIVIALVVFFLMTPKKVKAGYSDYLQTLFNRSLSIEVC